MSECVEITFLLYNLMYRYIRSDSNTLYGNVTITYIYNEYRLLDRAVEII